LKPLASATSESLRGIRAVLTDIDDTLTLHGRLPSTALLAMEQLQAAGLLVIPITGRPAGWCDHIARMWPVDAVVGENGAFTFRYDHKARHMERIYDQDSEMRIVNGARLRAIADEVLMTFPGTAIASDQAYREIDVAIDFCEDVPALPLETAQAIADFFAARGAVAKVSSIHVNAWFGTHDKLSMSLRLLRERFGMDAEEAKRSVAYCGDSPNDAPMFGYFPFGVGVANIKPLAHLVPQLPQYVTESQGGDGFAEFARMLLAAKGV
jgi:HAD superfamily hydrolase (TIGR01484 family)